MVNNRELVQGQAPIHGVPDRRLNRSGNQDWLGKTCRVFARLWDADAALRRPSSLARTCRTVGTQRARSIRHVGSTGLAAGSVVDGVGGLGLIRPRLLRGLTPSGRRRCAPASKFAARTCRTIGSRHGRSPSHTQKKRAFRPAFFLRMAGGLGLIRPRLLRGLTPSGRRRCAPASKFAARTCRTVGSNQGRSPGQTKTGPQGARSCLAGGLGFEPRLAESESAVLPLDDPPNVGYRL